MDLKNKFANLKKKIKEHPVAQDVAIIACCLGTAAYALYVSSRIDEVRKDIANAQDEVDRTVGAIRRIDDAVDHVHETGDTVTFFDGRGEPLFIMSAPEDK